MSGEPLPEPAARVAGFLQDARAEARMQEFREGTPTAEAAAEAIGCRLDAIVKSLIFLCDADPVLVMVDGSRRVDEEKARKATGASAVRMARPDVVRDRTGFEVGGVAPFPLPRIARAVIDQSLLRHQVVWVGAGTSRHMVGLSPIELVRLTKASSADVSQDMG
ncbi:MAG: YbaK/EbsC family protein [Gaiellales bacterium]